MCGPGDPLNELLCDECFGRMRDGDIQEQDDLCPECRERENRYCPSCDTLQDKQLEPGELCRRCQDEFDSPAHQALVEPENFAETYPWQCNLCERPISFRGLCKECREKMFHKECAPEEEEIS